MNLMNNIFFKLLFIYLLTTAPAFAYIDPGSGSVLVQMVVAGVVSVLVAIKMYWYKLKAAVCRLLGIKRETASMSEEEDDEL